MKKKNSDSLATKQDLQVIHDELKGEIGKLGKDANSVRADIDSLRKDVHNLREDIENLSEQVKDLPTKDQFYSKMDEAMGELKTIREEQETHSGSHDRMQETIDEHEERITVLEQKPL